jgi:hypothetical protein
MYKWIVLSVLNYAVGASIIINYHFYYCPLPASRAWDQVKESFLRWQFQSSFLSRKLETSSDSLAWNDLVVLLHILHSI